MVSLSEGPELQQAVAVRDLKAPFVEDKTTGGNKETD